MGFKRLLLGAGIVILTVSLLPIKAAENIEECKDENKQCSYWASIGECEANPSYMLKKCQKSCKLCKTEDSEEEECKDDSKQCPYWANIGECKHNPTYMLISCKKSCKICKGKEPSPEPEECKDDNKKCRGWARIGECKVNPSYMLKKCRKSCNVCVSDIPDPEEECIEASKMCPYWASIGECKKNPRYMLIKCMKSCLVCKTEEKPKVECTDKFRADFIFAVDASGSVKLENFKLMLQFMENVVREFPIGQDKVQVALVRFSSKSSQKTKVLFHLNKYDNIGDITNQIEATEYVKGNTYTAKALDLVREEVLLESNGARPGVPKIVVILTDGASTDWQNLPESVEKVKRAGARIFCVGIGRELNETQLGWMASDPTNEHILHANDFTQLQNLLVELKETTCKTRPSCDSGYELKIDRCVKCKTFQLADIVFVMDSSMSVGPRDFEKVKKFAEAAINSLKIGKHQVRISALRYSNKESTKIFLFLNSEFEKSDILAGIDDIDFSGGMTFSGYAMKMVKDNILKTETGMRKWAKHLVILITDGFSSDNLRNISAELQAQGAMIMAVAIGSGADVEELNNIVSQPSSENVIEVSSFDKLPSVVKKLEQKDCEEKRACPPGFLYKDDQCYQCKKDFKGDVVFVLDSSGSVKLPNFKKMLDFVWSVVGKWKIGPNKIRVSVVRYSSKHLLKVAFYLNDHFNAKGVQDAIMAVEFVAGSTHTAGALKAVKDDVLTEAKGSRPSEKRMVIVITDGQATDRLQLPEAVLDLQSTGAHIISVGIGDAADQESLESMASAPKDQNTIHVSNFDNLDKFIEKMQVKVCY